MKRYLLILLTSVLFLSPLFVSQAQANDGTAPACEYNRAIVGCERELFIVPTLPDDVDRVWFDTYGPYRTACADVGFNATWCVIVDLITPVSVPVPSFTG